MLNIKIIGSIIGVSLLCASLFANWWFLKETRALQEALALSKANEAVLLTTVDSLKRQSEAADASTKKYVISIQKLRKERDKLLTDRQSAKKTDSQYREWSDTVLPSFIVDKYNGMRAKDDSADNDQSDKNPTSTSP